MASDPVAITHASYAALNRGDIEGFLALMDPEIEFTSVMAGVEGEHGVFRGHEGLRSYLEQIREIWSEWRWDVLSVEELDDRRTLVAVRFTGKGRESEVPVSQELGLITTHDGERVLKIDAYPSPAEARIAASSSAAA